MREHQKSLSALGERIRSRREKLKLSQEALADRCGFDRTYISMLERGRRNPAFVNLIKLAEGLEMTLSTLIEGI
jgi:transcriptional regulator with XRE-family HTH domain